MRVRRPIFSSWRVGSLALCVALGQVILCGAAAAQGSEGGGGLVAAFQNPPAASRPWVFWFWINGNISKEGITADLEAMKRAGIGGVLWMEVSGPWWAPDGQVVPLSPEWHEAFQWAVRECERLGITFDATLDFGYGSGGPHITPDISMQKLYRSERVVDGGGDVDVALDRPEVSKKVSAWLRPGVEMNSRVLESIEKVDSYRDVAVLAIPVPGSPEARAYRIPDLDRKSGLRLHAAAKDGDVGLPPSGAVTPVERVIDLTSRMDRDGRLKWDAPPGQWLVIRFGHASNFKMTRPCPQAAVGLECDRLSKVGIETHFGAFLEKIIAGAGRSAGGALAYAHIDSWEAGCQNWTSSFPEEFRARRGYEIRPWLPVLTGRVVGSAEMSERFLWDVRTTVSGMIRDNYAARLRDLLRPHGMRLSIEAYGSLCIDNLSYAGVSDMPVSEFWARGAGRFPDLLAGRGGYARSSKAMASAAHTGGKPVVGAESFTSDRGWRDHPYLLKGMGDWAFCQGVNRMIFHLYAHQPYGKMIPGLTHRKWGEHFQRFNTWWEYGRVWNDYLSRCQFLLQQGKFVADVCYWSGEGAPLNVDDMALDLPAGYDYDLCSSENLSQMGVRDGRLVLPSGASYRYLLLPDADRMTLPLASKIRELVEAGARVVGGKRPKGAPGLTDYPACDAGVEKIAAALWDAGRVASGKGLAEVFIGDGLKPDFEGRGLLYIHRGIGDADAYFVSHQQDQTQDIDCTFRVAGKVPELWDPESGSIRELPEFSEREGRITLPLHFEPMQSWFVVFRKSGGGGIADRGRNFISPRRLREIKGGWRATFDPKWGGPAGPVALDALSDWSQHGDPRVRYYSGTAVYQQTFELSGSEASGEGTRLMLDLGRVEVMARVRLNGIECGIAWKPPYRVDITRAARPGKNDLEIDVVNLWINRMIGDEQLPEDGNWRDFETLLEWPEWFRTGASRSSGRRTFTTCRHYKKDSPLVPSGLFGPVTLQAMVREKEAP
ncbi:MAG TPA: glycosyl hydrolase [Verrucomicrobiae bacterium]|nr:glycosyl hydrolase [Verrucomicrobiae bacterium]